MVNIVCLRQTVRPSYKHGFNVLPADLSTCYSLFVYQDCNLLNDMTYNCHQNTVSCVIFALYL